MPGPYDETLSDEETKLLAEFENSSDLPPPDNSEEAPAAPAAPTAPATPAAPAEGAAPEAQAPEGAAEFQAFLEKHKGKSPEDLARIAFDQSKRAAATAFQERQTKQRVEDFTARLTAAAATAEAKRTEAETRRADFDKQLREDPDGATRALHDRLLTDEQRQAEEAVFTARREAAIGIASQAIPDADNAIPAAIQFGKEFNYSDEELGNISDPRDMVVLHLASVAGRMIKAGLIDAGGKILNMPSPVDPSPKDPRLQPKPGLGTIATNAGRAAPGTSSVEDQLTSYLEMSDDDLAKLPPGKLDALLKTAFQ